MTLPVKNYPQVNQTYAWPSTFDAFGRPVGWTPTSETRGEWGRLQIVMGGTDVTFWRGIPTEVRSWSSTDPFDDVSCELFFPQMSLFENFPSFMSTQGFEPDVDILLVRPDNSTKVLWEGTRLSAEISNDGWLVQCRGALYQLNDFLRPRPFQRIPQDLAYAIADEFYDEPSTPFAPRSNHESLRTALPEWYISGFEGVSTGAWQQTLSGYIQDLLAKMVDEDGNQYTVLKKPGRIPYINWRDYTTEHWAVACGQQGVRINLLNDVIDMSTTRYGEGISTSNCQWGNTKYPARDNPDWVLHPPFQEPLVTRTEVEKYLFDDDGNITGNNPDYDVTIPRRERYINFGPGTERLDAIFMAGKLPFFADNIGTVELDVDPESGSRFEIKAGQNIRLRFLGVVDEDLQPGLFHITRATVVPGGTVTLTVDQVGRDLIETEAGFRRDRENYEITRPKRALARRSRTVEDRISPFDCDAGAGVFTSVSVPNDSWTVLRIPTGQYGSIVRAEASASPARKFSIAVFNTEISANDLNNLMPHPLTANTDGSNPWDTFDYQIGDEFGEFGLIQAWGGPGQACGYAPKAESDDTATLTGQFLDNGSWSYRIDQYAPWLWVGFFATGGTTTISGKLYPGPEGYS